MTNFGPLLKGNLTNPKLITTFVYDKLFMSLNQPDRPVALELTIS